MMYKVQIKAASMEVAVRIARMNLTWSRCSS